MLDGTQAPANIQHGGPLHAMPLQFIQQPHSRFIRPFGAVGAGVVIHALFIEHQLDAFALGATGLGHYSTSISSPLSSTSGQLFSTQSATLCRELWAWPESVFTSAQQINASVH